MTVKLVPTTMLIDLNGVPTRIWEGETDSGIKVHAFITRMAVDKDEDQAQFNSELLQCKEPSPEIQNAYSLRMIL